MSRRSRRFSLLGAVAIVGMTGMVAAQESLLPPGFDKEPAPRSASAPKGAAAAKAATPPKAAPSAAPRATASTVAAPEPAASPAAAAAQAAPHQGVSPGPAVAMGDAGLDSIDPALLDAIIAKVQPRTDIPKSGSRSLTQVGVLAQDDGGLPAVSTHYLNGAFVEGVLAHTSGQFVSRWGHILMRRALASRLDTPVGMNGADWAALRAQVLLRMGEADAARALVQEVDSGAYTPSLEDAALGSYLATSDPVGLCPITALTAVRRQGWDWDMVRAICSAFTGDGPPAMAQLDHAMRRGNGASRIDVLLAQKFAGSVAQSRRAVTIEWKDVDQLTPWRTGLSLATGLEPPQDLRDKAGNAYQLIAARAPMLPLASRAAAADVAGGQGVLSSAAMIDLYSQIATLETQDKVWSPLAAQLRTAYVAAEQADRVTAIKGLWGDASNPDRAYSRLVLTAYAAARLAPSETFSDDAGPLIASMLTAGLDRNAIRWAPYVSAGSEAWGLLALSSPAKLAPVAGGVLDTFRSNDSSSDSLRSRFLLAGLMGLGRVDDTTARDFATRLKVDMGRQTRWTRAIDEAAQSNNPALVTFLAGFGMQGAGWDKMTAVNLFHIVSALRRVGLDGEARMIAAEAVARV